MLEPCRCSLFSNKALILSFSIILCTVCGILFMKLCHYGGIHQQYPSQLHQNDDHDGLQTQLYQTIKANKARRNSSQMKYERMDNRSIHNNRKAKPFLMINGSGLARNGTKVILFWSRRPDDDDMIRPFDLTISGSGVYKKCEWSDCELTRDRRRWSDASVIVYRPVDPYPDWPPTRFPNQSYVHLLSDRPCAIHWWLPKFEGQINLTVNYRHDADIPHYLTATVTDHPRVGKYVARIPWSNKTKSVVWAASHCKTASRREEYVAELSKYIDVDIYGLCGNLTCPRQEQSRCSEIWENNYKFYLAFENSICRDYITEKFYRTLNLELIPVVFGGGHYAAVAPPHSYIDVKDYKTPKELAGYLQSLANNEEKYVEYFQWKQKYVVKRNVKLSCKFCEVAHNIEKWTRPAHSNYYNWWMTGCHNKRLAKMRALGKW